MPAHPNETDVVARRRRNLKAWIDDHFNGVQAAFVERTGINQGELSGLLKAKSFGEKKARALEAQAGMPQWWLDTQDEELVIRNTSPGPEIRGSVPLISWVQAGDYVEAIDHLSPGEGEHIETTVPVKAHTYALRVDGDSMEPEFPSGCIIIVEPDMEPRHSDYIVIKNGENEATFKQLIQDGADWYLKPINPRYPVKPLPKGAVFCGVVRGMERRFR